MSFSIGDKLPNLTVATTQNEALQLSSYQGKKLVMYFYPKDNTPGCTQEGKDFTEHYAKFQKLNTEIVGVSKDSIKKHSNFIEKYGFTFDLISDPEETLCNALDVRKEKNMYGKKYMGVIRSHWIIDEAGNIADAQVKISPKKSIEKATKVLAE